MQAHLLPDQFSVLVRNKAVFREYIVVVVYHCNNNEHFHDVRMGSRPILPVKGTVTIDTMLNFDGDCDGDVFTPVCHSVHRGGSWADPPIGYYRYGQRAGGTHLTGMHSCLILWFC